MLFRPTRRQAQKWKREVRARAVYVVFGAIFAAFMWISRPPRYGVRPSHFSRLDPLYTKAQFDIDFGNAMEEIQHYNEHLETSNLTLCSQVGAKFPISREGRIPDLERVTIEGTQWIFRYNDYIKYAHMSMVTHWKGLLITAWQAAPCPSRFVEKAGGYQEVITEGLNEQRLLYSVSQDMGRTWGNPMTLELLSSGAVWSPVLHVDADERLWLFYTESTKCLRPTQPPTWTPGGDVKVVTLANPKSLTAGVYGPNDAPLWSMPRVIHTQEAAGGTPNVIANKLIEMSNGEWLLPVWREPPDEDERGICEGDGHQSAGVLISSDKGQTWRAFGVIDDPRTQLLEGTAVELRNRQLLMLLRSSTGCMMEVRSVDFGRTWSVPRASRLPNPNTKMHMMTLQPSGHLLMAFNNHKHTAAGMPNSCKGCRTYLDIAVSTDDGYNWRKLATVDGEISPGVRIHYPTMEQVGSKLLVVYSRFYLYPDPGLYSQEQGIRLVEFDIGDVLARGPSSVLRVPPTREALVRMVDHFIATQHGSQLRKLGMRPGRWKRLATMIASTYELGYLGGARWLVTKKHFGAFATKVVWEAIEQSRQGLAGEIEDGEGEEEEQPAEGLRTEDASLVMEPPPPVVLTPTLQPRKSRGSGGRRGAPPIVEQPMEASAVFVDPGDEDEDVDGGGRGGFGAGEGEDESSY